MNKVPWLLHYHRTFQKYVSPWISNSVQWWSYSRVRLRVYARVTRFTFSAAISNSLELKRSSIALWKAQSNSKKMQQSKFEKLHPQSVKTGLNKKGLFHSNQFWQTVDEAFQILIAAFFLNCFGLSKELSNSFLTQGT